MRSIHTIRVERKIISMTSLRCNFISSYPPSLSPSLSHFLSLSVSLSLSLTLPLSLCLSLPLSHTSSLSLSLSLSQRCMDLNHDKRVGVHFQDSNSQSELINQYLEVHTPSSPLLPSLILLSSPGLESQISPSSGEVSTLERIWWTGPPPPSLLSSH
jgi:hypothetical protein